MFRPLLLSAAALLASGCTLVTGNFTECATADDCGAGRTCVSGFCVEPGCNDVYGATDDPKAIPIGAALPLTVTGGGQDQSELQGLNAIRLAVEEINQRQGVAGRPFALYVCDTAGDAAKIKEQVAYLIDTKKVPAVITSGSGQTLAASSVTISKGALLMSATATSPELTDVSDKPGGASVGLLWRTAPSDAIQGRVIADLLTNAANATYGLNALAKIDLLYVNDVYGQGLSGVVRDRLSGKGKTVQEQFFARGATDAEIDTLVSNLDADDPDVTVVIGFPDDLTRILPKAVSKPNLMRSSGHKWLFTDAAKDPALYADANVKAMIDGLVRHRSRAGRRLRLRRVQAALPEPLQRRPGQLLVHLALLRRDVSARALLRLGDRLGLGRAHRRADGGGADPGLERNGATRCSPTSSPRRSRSSRRRPRSTSMARAGS